MTSDELRRPSRKYPFTIDGDELSAPHQRMKVADLIVIALRGGVLKPEPEGYTLDDGQGTTYNDDDVVDLGATSAFYAVERHPTPASTSSGR